MPPKTEYISGKTEQTQLIPTTHVSQSEEGVKTALGNLTGTASGASIMIAFFVLITVIFLAIRFPKEFKELLSKITGVKFGKDSGITFHSPEAVSTPEVQVEILKEEAKELEVDNKTPEISEEEPKTIGEWKRELFFRSIMGEQDKAEKAFIQLKQLTKDDELKIIEITYFEYKVRFLKDIKALDELKKFTEDKLNSPEVIREAYESIGSVYSYLHSYPESIKAFEQALDKSSSDVDRSKTISQLATATWENNEKNKAFELLEDRLGQFKDPESKINIYRTIADLKNKEKDYEGRAFAVEKIIELGDLSNDNSFSAGYSYSEIGIDDLSLLHYKNARRLGDSSTALNNLGVEYERLGLPMMSVNAYKESFSNNETLAAANMAKKLLSIGFSDEAKKILDEAVKKEKVDDDVNTVLASIKDRETKEEEKEEKFINAAQIVQKFMRDFSGNFYEKKSIKTINANYYVNKNEDVVVTVQDGKIICRWNQKSPFSEYKYKYKLEGDLHNNAAKIVIFKESLRASTSKDNEELWEKNSDGYLYIQDNGSLSLMSYENDDKNNSKFFSFIKR